jgi:Flp pilus assembly protein CpaB
MRVGRPRSLPPGRAVVGGLLIAAAAVLVFAATMASAGARTGTYVVAARPLAAGTVVAPGDVTTARMALSPAARRLAFADPGFLVGRSLALGVEAGELLEQPMLVPADAQPALRPVSVSVDPASVAGLQPGQTVDVLATTGSGGSSRVVVILRGATLIDESAGSGSLSPGGATLVTLGVASLSEVEAVVQAAQAGTVSLVVAEPSDGVGPGPGT